MMMTNSAVFAASFVVAAKATKTAPSVSSLFLLAASSDKTLLQQRWRQRLPAPRWGQLPPSVRSAKAAAAASTNDDDGGGGGRQRGDMETILFVECGFGADAHGQNSTKAAVRACRNAIEFNQIPCIGDVVPGGRDEMKLDVLVACPAKYRADLDHDAIERCFPYGKVRIQLQDGGMIANHGKMIESLGDVNEDMIVVCVAVTVGY